MQLNPGILDNVDSLGSSNDLFRPSSPQHHHTFSPTLVGVQSPSATGDSLPYRLDDSRVNHINRAQGADLYLTGPLQPSFFSTRSSSDGPQSSSVPQPEKAANDTDSMVNNSIVCYSKLNDSGYVSGTEVATVQARTPFFPSAESRTFEPSIASVITPNTVAGRFDIRHGAREDISALELPPANLITTPGDFLGDFSLVEPCAGVTDEELADTWIDQFLADLGGAQ